MSCCRLAGHNFEKYVNSDPCKERKLCVKWINDNTFLAISDFVDKRFLDNFVFGRLRTSSEDFGLLRKWSCRFQRSQHSQDKNLTPTSQKKLAGIQSEANIKLPHSIVVESSVKAFQYKVINSILYKNTKLYKIGFRTNDLCTFCDNQPESLTHLFYHCSRAKQFWSESELYWCLVSNQRIRLCLENVPFGILTENAFPSLQLLNYFIIIGKLYLWDCRSKQILPNIYGFRAKIIAKYEIEEKISNKEFFKRKWILTPYLS